MRKTMIRNTVIMAVLSVVLGIVLALYLRSTFASPVAGDMYVATKAGFSSDVKVEVVIDGGKITSVNADVSGETPEIGGTHGPELAKAIAAAGTTEGVDAITGATLTSNAILDAVNDCMAQAGAGAAEGDVYTASAQGFGGEVKVEVSIADGKITGVNADVSTETPEIGGTFGPELAASIAAAGTTEGVDAIAGATLTSNAILDAVNDCMAQAGL